MANFQPSRPYACKAAKFYLPKDVCLKTRQISSYFTLHLITVGKLKKFKKSFK